MRLTSESKFLLGVLLVTVLIIGGAFWLFSKPTKPIGKDVLAPPTAHTFGNPAAKTYLVEFSDFQCPACGAFEPAVENMLNKDKDKFLFVYRHFPLPQHEQAVPAAHAAEAAGKQGKFWEMHNLLFANQSTLSSDLYTSLAKQLNLDMTQFTADMQASDVVNLVNGDVSVGNSIGIDATPTFFLNGTKINPVNPADLQSLVETAINK
ncbi:thioredoxin domain-containing protein [Candidatus Gottesmanbacteria bacterium]|nr:thioredoxin domain-containing protein [Candidatus Gottesmanbacteria bacterium]